MFKKYSKDFNKETNNYEGEEIKMEQYKDQQINKTLSEGDTENRSRFFDLSNNISMNIQEYDANDDTQYAADWNDKVEEAVIPKAYNSTIFDGEEPETVLGEGVAFKGCLQFKRYLRVDGVFEGELVSEGKLVVGPKGVVKSDVQMHEVIVEGYLEGNITVEERVELRGEAQVHGDITARSLSVDDGVTIVGHVCVKPESPMAIDVNEAEQD